MKNYLGARCKLILITLFYLQFSKTPIKTLIPLFFSKIPNPLPSSPNLASVQHQTGIISKNSKISSFNLDLLFLYSFFFTFYFLKKEKKKRESNKRKLNKWKKIIEERNKKVRNKRKRKLRERELKTIDL